MPPGNRAHMQERVVHGLLLGHAVKTIMDGGGLVSNNILVEMIHEQSNVQCRNGCVQAGAGGDAY